MAGCSLPSGNTGGSINSPGDVIIGGTFRVHMEGVDKNLHFTSQPTDLQCQIIATEFYQTMRALIFAIEEINADTELLPNVTLGFQALDSCNTLRRAAQGTLSMLSGGKEAIPNYHCHGGTPFAGLVGDSGSTRSILIAQILGLYRYPQISYFATSPVLTNRNLFPSFFRTIPSDEFQMKGLAQLIDHFGWSWLGLLANDDDYGQFGLQLIKQEIINSGACVAFAENILTSQPDRNAPYLTNIIKESTAKVVVVVASDSDFVVVLEELLRQNVSGHIWVASEAWATSDLLSEERFKGILLGTIGFAIFHGKMPKFSKYFTSLNPSKDVSDPFITEFWEQTFACTWPREKNQVMVMDNATISPCTGNEMLYVLPSEEDQRLSLNLLHYIKNVNFKTNDGRQVFFDGAGNPPAIYDIVNWQVGARGMLEQVTVGSYELNGSSGKMFNIDSAKILWINNNTQIPPSQCSPRCPSGYRKVIVQGKPLCCYDCARCPQGQISNQTDAAECQPCSWDTWPNLQQDRCLPRPTEFLSYEQPLGYSLAAISIFSTLAPLVVLRIFVCNNKTPIVRANNYSLSCLLLLSLFLCFLCSLGFIGYPQPEKCLLRQVAFGMVFALCISCVLAKTITVVIAFNATKPGSRLRQWTGVKVSYCVIGFCIFVQLCVCGIWLILSPPFSEFDTETKPGIIIINCNEGSPTAFWCMLGYLGLLASISFIVAFLARRLPDSFNEAKLITFSMLAFLSVWVSFIPAYLSARGIYTVAMEVFAILSSSWAVVGCIFVSKCYIVLFRPNMNSREHLLGKSRIQN
ncbi:extracellular calcium-sensing receptor [Xenopus tropicalis]|uniref:Extracellular calcium-sensing receptor n=1 Tax=Xenopus tropicalis TaxID=8364 RepID=A0A8J1J8G6_XENTR|nr:extracellular calcium-sensing receptor [Xenopus tropicalis]